MGQINSADYGKVIEPGKGFGIKALKAPYSGFTVCPSMIGCAEDYFRSGYGRNQHGPGNQFFPANQQSGFFALNGSHAEAKPVGFKYRSGPEIPHNQRHGLSRLIALQILTEDEQAILKLIVLLRDKADQKSGVMTSCAGSQQIQLTGPKAGTVKLENGFRGNDNLRAFYELVGNLVSDKGRPFVSFGYGIIIKILEISVEGVPILRRRGGFVGQIGSCNNCQRDQNKDSLIYFGQLNRYDDNGRDQHKTKNALAREEIACRHKGRRDCDCAHWRQDRHKTGQNTSLSLAGDYSQSAH